MKTLRLGIVETASNYLDPSKMNDVESIGILMGFELIKHLKSRQSIVCGDSDLLERYIRIKIEC